MTLIVLVVISQVLTKKNFYILLRVKLAQVIYKVRNNTVMTTLLPN